MFQPTKYLLYLLSFKKNSSSLYEYARNLRVENYILVVWSPLMETAGPYHDVLYE